MLPLVVAHIQRVCSFLDAPSPSGRRRSSRVSATLAFPSDLHVANHSERHADEYFRRLAELLMSRLFDESRIGGGARRPSALQLQRTRNGGGGGGGGDPLLDWSCEATRVMLREIIAFSVLWPALDFLTSPETLNRLVIMALDTNSATRNEPTADCAPQVAIIFCFALSDSSPSFLQTDQVPILECFGASSRSPAAGSLLQLKLSDLVKEPRLLQSFDRFLHEANGPTHVLDGFLQARDLLHRLQALNVSVFWRRRKKLCVFFCSTLLLFRAERK